MQAHRFLVRNPRDILTIPPFRDMNTYNILQFIELLELVTPLKLPHHIKRRCEFKIYMKNDRIACIACQSQICQSDTLEVTQWKEKTVDKETILRETEIGSFQQVIDIAKKVIEKTTKSFVEYSFCVSKPKNQCLLDMKCSFAK